MPNTLLAEKLLECQELEQLYGCLPPCEERDSIAKRLEDAKRIIEYLRERFIALNRTRPAVASAVTGKPSPIDVERTRAEMAKLDTGALLRYGHVLRWVCTAEADLAPDHTLEVNEALLVEAKREWRRRFLGRINEDSV
jgi:hypothetical protein